MTAEVEQLRAHYDAVPYPAAAATSTHPDNPRTVAALAGFTTPDVTRCRVLEIGCAIGRNLLPMAQTLPNSMFLGIDLSSRQIEMGNAVLRQVGLNNVELRCQDLLDFGRDEGPFDYIIAHGVYSWVPENVRDRLMQVCAQHLSPGGVANITYNTLPGWYLKRVQRDMMLFNGAGDQQLAPAQRIAKAREMMSFASQPSPGWRPYKEILSEADKKLAEQTDWYILHDHIEPVSHPVYFEQFIKHAAANGLVYVGDAAPGIDALEMIAPAIVEQARRFSGDDPIRLQQYLDFLQGRQYRGSILCRADAPRGATPASSLDLISSLYIAGRLVEETSGHDPATGKPLTNFMSIAKTMKLALSDERVIAVFRRIRSAWPHAVPFSQLVQGIYDPATDGGVAPLGELLARALLAGYRSMMIELWTRPTDFLPARFDRPRATPLARLQAASGEPLTNLRHQNVPCSEATKAILPLADGTRNRSALLREMTRLIQRGQLKLPAHGGGGGGFITPSHDLPAILDQVLTEFYANSLLSV